MTDIIEKTASTSGFFALRSENYKPDDEVETIKPCGFFALRSKNYKPNTEGDERELSEPIETIQDKPHGFYALKSKNRIEPQEIKKVKKPVELPDGCFTLSTDSEYIPITDSPTIPLCIQFADGADNRKEYLHPDHPFTNSQLQKISSRLDELGEDTLSIFEADTAILDYYQDVYGIEYRRSEKKTKRKYTKIIDLYIFFSFKDLQFIFKNEDDYKFYVLSKLERIRRITTKFNSTIALPYEMYLYDKNSKKMKWTHISLNILDVSAMQGGKGLKTYLGNVGMSTDDKEEYKNDEKSRMDLRLLEDTERFLRYIRSDVNLHILKSKTVDFYNKIANLIGVDPREDWGMSTGKITASMISDWIANQVNIPVCDITEKDESREDGKTKGLYQYTRLGNPEAIKQLSHLAGNKNLLYLGMTDGGRCVKERVLLDYIKGVLVDIDISSCYASGLLNQSFAVGNPKIITSPLKYKDWEKKFKSKITSGLWVSRISWKNAPFKQDILISKDEKQFTKWDFYQQSQGENGSDDKNYDAAMYLMTNDIHQAAYTHDLMQVIHNYSNQYELNWIRENAVIESFGYYASNEEIDELQESLLLMESFDKFGKGGLKWKTKWKRIELKKVMSVLINRRQVHKKLMKFYEEEIKENYQTTDYQSLEKLPIVIKNYWEELGQLKHRIETNNFTYEYSENDFKYHSSIQEFIKLIGNTVYGCIASVFFGGNGTGISNYIIGNNITARARTLAWCMAKGFHSLMSITDGGVFDANKVLSYRRKSLDIFSNVAYECFSNESDRKTVVDIIPLYGQEIPFDTSMQKVLLNENNHVEKLAWEHLKNIFPKLDIFIFDQFSFEVKKVYTECTLRNKSDYVLKNEFTDKKTVRIRGVKRDENSDAMVEDIFDKIERGESDKITQFSKRMIGLNEWRDREILQKEFLPHDEISTVKDFFTITPLGCRFINTEHRKKVMRAYDKARFKKDAKAITRIKELETMRVYTSRSDSFKDNSN